MARLVRYQPNRRGIRELAASEAVDAELERRGQRIATAAESAYQAGGYEVPVEVVQASSDTDERARVAVVARHPAALRIEAKHRILGGSLDAARG